MLLSPRSENCVDGEIQLGPRLLDLDRCLARARKERVLGVGKLLISSVVCWTRCLEMKSSAGGLDQWFLD